MPVRVPEEERERFESAMIDFLFGYDRLRPDLEEAVSKRGVDTKRLASLCAPEPLGVCPTPGAREFIPPPALTRLAAERGFTFTRGGRVFVHFNYEHHAEGRAAPEQTLEVNLGLPPGFVGAEEARSDVVGEVTRALFGDCQLPARAQDYLRAHGVDVVELATESRAGPGEAVPPTTRVRPGVEQVLNELGFRIDRHGQFAVNSIRDLARLSKAGDDPWTKTIWSKTTCC